MTPPAPDEENVDTRVALARMETKLDLVLGQHGTKLDDHEARLRIVEDRKTVSPMSLLSAVGGGVGVLGGLVLLLQSINLTP